MPFYDGFTGRGVDVPDSEGAVSGAGEDLGG